MKTLAVVAVIIILIVIAVAWYTGILKLGSQVPTITSATQAGKATTDISSTIDQIGSTLASIQSKLG